MGTYYEPNTAPKSCDITKLRELYCPVTPTPTPTPNPNPTPIPGGCYGAPDYESISDNRVALSALFMTERLAHAIRVLSAIVIASAVYDYDSCNCSGGCGADGSCSPIVIDVDGNGFELTEFGKRCFIRH